MRTIFKVIFSLFGCAGIAITASAEVKRIVIFGDSVSDIGNVYYLTKALNKDPQTSAQYLVDPLQKSFDQHIQNAPIGPIAKKFLEHHSDRIIESIGVDLQKMFSHAGVPITPQAPYFQGHFSNSCVWNEYLADALKLKRKLEINTNNPKDLKQYDNRAFGGSWTVTNDHEFWRQIKDLIKHDKIWQKAFFDDIKAAFVDRLNGKFIPPSLGNVLNAYLVEQPKPADKDTLFFMFYGGNDYLNYALFPKADDPKTMDKYTSNVINTTIKNLQRLIDHGAKQIVVFDMPNLAVSPRFSTGKMKQYNHVISQAIQMNNNKLKQEVAKLQSANKGKVKIALFDIADKLGAIINNHEKYGFKVIDQPCVVTNLGEPNSSHDKNKQLKAIAPVKQNPELQLAVMTAKSYKGPQEGASPLDFRCTNKSVTISNNPSEFIFFDDVHPTTHSHQIIAAELLKFLKEHNYIAASSKSKIEQQQQCTPTKSMQFEPVKYYNNLKGFF